MTGRTLRTSAAIAGMISAATAGALTVGLVAGVVHTAQAPSATGTGTGAGTASVGTSAGVGSTRTNNTSSGLGSVSQNAAPHGASHGS